MALLLRGGSRLQKRSRSAGFALPTILISSVVMLIVLLVSVGSTTAVRTAIKDQYYQQLALAAGEAGVAYAEACLNANGGVPLWTDAAPLKPNTDCSGVELVACPTTSTNPLCSVTLNGNIRSSFSMGKPLVEAPEVLVVAGGGSGGGSTGGGGGGGGVVYVPSSPLEVGSYSVDVGAGGAIPGNQQQGRSGENSSFNGIVAIGGGGGGHSVSGGIATSGLAGGSGGGGQSYSGTYLGGLGTPQQGNNGGTPTNAGAGGGGGAGAAGGVSATTNIGGAGGAGLANSITGSSVLYGGGGGGGNTGAAGSGGGGAGSTSSGVGGNGTANTGGGGGGGWAYATGNGGSGGSGVVVVSYPTNLITATGGTTSTVNGKRIHRFTSDGTLNVTNVTNAVKTLPNTGYVEVLRSSTSAVWRRYDQKSAPVSVVPDLCSGVAKSIYGWNNATVVESAKTIPGFEAEAIALGVGSLNPGKAYFRKDFSISQAGTYNLHSRAGGSPVVAYIDGNLVMSASGSHTMETVTLESGCHALEVRLANGAVLPNDFDLKMVLVKPGATIPVVKTDASWRVSAGPLVHFSSPDYYMSASWGPVREIQAYYATAPVWGAASPAWNTTSGGDTSARWISTTHSYTSTASYPANSSTFFRDNTPINVSTPTEVRVTYACDDTCEIWLDGSVIATKTTGSSVTVSNITTTLTAGNHQFGASVNNGGLGASGVLFAVVRTSDGTTLSSSGLGWSAANDWYPTASAPSAFSYSNTYKPNPTELSSASARVLVVGGGGGGGSDMGGGGGGGGVVQQTSYSLTAGSYAVEVGAGGVGAPAGISQVRGGNGEDSIFDTLRAVGGGGGGSEYANNNSPPGSGGSGGGSAGCNQNAYGTGLLGQGFRSGLTTGCYYPTGGGGAGGVGLVSPGHGGPGVQNNILGTNYYWGGGGGGSGYTGVGGNGGAGGGGGGAIGVTTGGSGLNAGSSGTNGCTVCQANVPGGNAGANTGGGGGGGSHYNSNNRGGNGGSGIVVISYPTGSMTATGGTITTSGGNTIHRFTSSGTFIVTEI